MTTVLAIIGGIVVLLGTATRIPLALSSLVRACIPLVHALDDLHEAIRHRRRRLDDSGTDEDEDQNHTVSKHDQQDAAAGK